MTTNTERVAEAMKTHDLFYFKSGDGWMEPHEEVIRCACGEEFYFYIQTGDGSYDDDRDPDVLYRQHLAQALADAGLLKADNGEAELIAEVIRLREEITSLRDDLKEDGEKVGATASEMEEFATCGRIAKQLTRIFGGRRWLT